MDLDTVKLENACKGKSAANGGLDFNEIKRLASYHGIIVNTKKRDDILKELCDLLLKPKKILKPVIPTKLEAKPQLKLKPVIPSKLAAKPQLKLKPVIPTKLEPQLKLKPVIPKAKDLKQLIPSNLDQLPEKRINFYTIGVNNGSLITDPKYAPFSNFHHAPFVVDGIKWNTVEAYFQAQKINHPGNDPIMINKYQSLMALTDSPSKVFTLGNFKFQHGYKGNTRLNKNDLRTLNQIIAEYTNEEIKPSWKNADELQTFRNHANHGKLLTFDPVYWNEHKIDIMYNGLYHKFTQYPKLKDLLLGTGSSYIAEHTARDKFWADGADDSGQNMLGKLLMKLRDDLR